MSERAQGHTARKLASEAILSSTEENSPAKEEQTDMVERLREPSWLVGLWIGFTKESSKEPKPLLWVLISLAVGHKFPPLGNRDGDRPGLSQAPPARISFGYFSKAPHEGVRMTGKELRAQTQAR